jgi:hypothetical protein
MTMTETMTEFQGRTITKHTAAVKRAGDGLSQSLKIEPAELAQGQTVYLVVEATVGKIEFIPIGDLEEERKVNLDAVAATLIDSDVVRDTLASMKERIQLEKEKQAGVGRLPTPEHLESEHRFGIHENDPAVGCSLCEEAQAEQDAGDGTA